MARRSTAAFCYSGQSHDLLPFLSFTVMPFIQYSEICLNTRVFSFTVSGEQACICKAYKQRVYFNLTNSELHQLKTHHQTRLGG